MTKEKEELSNNTFIRGNLAGANLPTEKGFQHQGKQAQRKSTYYAIVRCIYVCVRLRMPDEVWGLCVHNIGEHSRSVAMFQAEAALQM